MTDLWEMWPTVCQ